MPKIPTNFTGYDNFDAKTRLGLDQDGNVESTGRQKDNIFKRAWSCLTRDRDTIENNKATTRPVWHRFSCGPNWNMVGR